MKYFWHAEEVPESLPVKQVHGVLLTRDSRVLIRIKEGVARLTGGRPEANETFSETLDRETLEEASAKLGEKKYLGYQIPEGETYAQVRMVALIEEILPAKADPDRAGEWIYGRELLPFNLAKVRLKESFGELGEQLLDAAFKVAEQEKWFASRSEKAEVLNLESKTP